MHHALKIQEILLNILHHCPLSVRAALAKPCRAFKDPALDTLWQFLFSLAPLAQCLPEVSHQVSSWHKKTDETSFKVTHIPFDLYWTSGISDSTRIPL
ncbi:hypothetical protein V8E55_004305 [Tylopilus felleus]